ncbi:MAG: thioredoxin family protein [Methanomassiliicoccales archaeon]|jgi:thioredoxin 1|nr:thioredoxin family protein [Methanomassiliicoccales archaeon]MDD1755377.1 thioredoxin family protein [Methanomassiliicoccales archaeon]
MEGTLPQAEKGKEGDWPEKAMDLSEVDVDGVLHRFDLVVIDCWVGWCKHSKRMLPIYEGLAADMAGKAYFGKVDAQVDYHFPVQYRIRATPTFLIFKKGVLVDRLIGELSREDLEHAVRRHRGLL